ncbi:putative membrane domain protein, partial [Vibrio parahaemolyticus V-223/04]
RFC